MKDAGKRAQYQLFQQKALRVLQKLEAPKSADQVEEFMIQYNKGEQVIVDIVDAESDGGWSFGTRVGSGDKGWFPSGFIAPPRQS